MEAALLERLLTRIKENNLEVDIDKISQAYVLAYESRIKEKYEKTILYPVEVSKYW